jgi:DNA repair protein RecN (Recombination protein N)
VLTRIAITDLVIVSALELELGPGMTALTGETGAGKSILIDALGLALGDKADADMIRSGRDRAEVGAELDLSGNPEAVAWLAERALADPDDPAALVIRRVLTRRGRARATINGRTATGAQLRDLGDLLVDIHGQHAHQSLLRPAAQRGLLDDYGGLGTAAAEVAERWRRYHELDRRWQALTAAREERAAKLELLRFQVDELTELGLGNEELQALDAEQHRLANLGSLQAATAALVNLLYDGEPALRDQLGRAAADLTGLSGIDPQLAEPRELIEGALVQVDEAAGTLRLYLDGLELDPDRLAEVEGRLARIHDLARKYRVPPEALPAHLGRLRTELEALEQADQSVGDLGTARDAARAALLAQAEALSTARTDAAARLGETVTDTMQALGMAGGRFAVMVERAAAEAVASHGLDTLAFHVSANPGQPPKPLAKVASGGELSRISLAIQVATAEVGRIPTLVFDEVDVGIGGRVAEIVGRLLQRLGASRQVLCVTHLPQVAARAHRQLRVRKRILDGTTLTEIQPLDDTARIDEIARMLGGTEITATTRAHAAEMLAQA